MAQVKFDIWELVSLVRGEGFSTTEAKRKIAEALVDVFESKEWRTAIEKRAEEIATEHIRKVMHSGFIEVTTSGYGTNKKQDIQGWAADILKLHINKSYGQIDYVSFIKADIQKVLEDLEKRYHLTLEDAKPFIAKETRALLPEYVTDEYRERVARVFDSKQVEQLVTEMIQRVVGGMIASGALRLNIKGEEKS